MTHQLKWVLGAFLVVGGLALTVPEAGRTAESAKSSCGLCLPLSTARAEAPPPPVHHHVSIPGKVNPHGRSGRCASCHLPGREPAAESWRPGACLECHDAQAHLRAIHPTDFAGDSPKAPAFAGAPLQDGRSTCLTCHAVHCAPETRHRVSRENRSMLRGGPWPRETDFCYQCHDRGLYQPVNPHLAGAEGRVCWYCHVGSGGTGPVPGTDLQLLQGELCLKCHKDVKHEREHMGRSVLHNRLKMDTAAALASFQAGSGVVLPLDPEGRVACATCHSPNPACSRGAPPASKLLRAAKERICYACHDL
jgi:hypothetical protein